MKKWLKAIVSLVMVLTMVMGTTAVFAETAETTSVTFEASMMDSLNESLSASAMRKESDLYPVAVVAMICDVIANELVDPTIVGAGETWVTTTDDTIEFFFFVEDGLHVVGYTPNQPATYTFFPGSTDDVQSELNDNDTLGKWDSAYYCSPEEILAVLDQILD